MKKILLRSAVILPFLLAACTAPVDEPPTPSAEQEQAQGPQQVTSEALRISFTYPIPLKSNGAGDIPPTEDWESAEGPMYGEVFEAGPASQGLADWAVPTGVLEKIRQTPACDLLASPDVYLPVAFEEPSRCDVVKNEDGSIVFYAIGFGRPHEGYTFRESLLLAIPPSGSNLSMLQRVSSIAPYPPAAEAVLASEGQVDFPSPNFEQNLNLIEDALRADLNSTSPELEDAMRGMWVVARSVRFL
jgi:hypothetical protein